MLLVKAPQMAVLRYMTAFQEHRITSASSMLSKSVGL